MREKKAISKLNQRPLDGKTEYDKSVHSSQINLEFITLPIKTKTGSGTI